jgi:hypothetical protein
VSTDTTNNETNAVTFGPDRQVESTAPTAVDRRDATVMELAAVFAGSRDFPDCRTAEKAAVRILFGREMGVPPATAMSGIRVNNGRASMDGCLMAGAIERSGKYDFVKLASNAEIARIEFFRDGQSRGEAVFTVEDAKLAGLLGKDTWKKYPVAMLWWRAMSAGARMYCAGLFGGAVYAHEELGYQVDQDGRIVESEGGSVAGSELCTRDQRQRIAELNDLDGNSLVGLTASLGIRMLDELSAAEADKLIKKLEKKLIKAGKMPAETPGTKPAAGGTSGPATDATEATAHATTDLAATPMLTPAQQMLADAQEDARKPSTRAQRFEILELAARIEPDEEKRVAAVVAMLAKRNVAKINELTALQAASLIYSMQQVLGDQSPFVQPAGTTSTGEPKSPPAAS